MKPSLSLIPEPVANRIFLIRGHRVMLDRDLAELYGVPVKSLNLAVKRNNSRFPIDFMFRLTEAELPSSRFQNETLKIRRGQNIKYLPYAFTEQGVAMLSSVLRSERAVAVNISIMRAFVQLRQMASTHEDIRRKVMQLDRKVKGHDNLIQEIYEALNRLEEPPTESPKIIRGIQP